MSRKKMLWVIDPYDPIVSLQQVYSMCQYHFKLRNHIYIQLLEYHPKVYRKLSETATILPPFSWNTEKNRNKENGSYQFTSFSIPKNIRLATYNYPGLVKLYWRHMQKFIIKDDRFYDEAVAFSQGLPQYYVKDCINAKRIITHQYIFQPECEEIYIGRNHLTLTNSPTVHLYLLHKKIPVLYLKSLFATNNLRVASEIGPRYMDQFPGIKVLVPNSWDNSLQVENFVTLCKLVMKSHSSVRWYLFGKSNYTEQLAEMAYQHKLFQVITLLDNVNNGYGYLKDADIYMEWGGEYSFLKEAIFFNIPVYSYKYRDHCNTYLDHKIWNKDIAKLLSLFRNTEIK